MMFRELTVYRSRCKQRFSFFNVDWHKFISLQRLYHIDKFID